MKVVLAFSGGLDTSFCAVYLSRDKGFDVHALMVNTGGFSETEISRIQQHAQALGVSSFKSIDAKEQYYQSVIKYMVFGNVLRNNTYPLSVSAERTVQAIAIAQYAKEIGADYVAHGSTGAGNDQVRFDMVFQILIPHVKVITPIRDLKLSREEEIQYLQKFGIQMNFEKVAYSINKGIWGTFVGGKETLTSRMPLPESAFPSPLLAQTPMDIRLKFVKGELLGVDNIDYSYSVDAIQALQKVAEPFAIGRDIHVGDTIIGIKGRVGFEAAVPLLIIKAHHLLEKHTLTNLTPIYLLYYLTLIMIQ